ncbi:hypothetical protein [Veillonella agrestimuris]|uniref:hypothetical protein n=1 Tax=Veillonella agrestimuris TaxID=2941340 RepID=UPI00203E6C49|nr:hypothetical protein [Veillonella agrestimuris]
MEDIHNEASSKAKQSGFSMDTAGLIANGLLGKINPLGLVPVVSIPVSDQANSTTRSAISDSIIVDVEQTSLEEINRHTEDALQSLAPIFNKEHVQEKMAYVNALSEEGFKLIGDVSLSQVKR